MLIAVASFVGVLVIFLAAYWWLIVRPETAAGRELEKRLNPAGTLPATAQRSLLNTETPLSSLPAFDRLLTQSTRVIRPLAKLIERSAVKITVGQFILATLFLAVLAAVLVVRLTGLLWAAPVAAVVAGVIPFSWVRHAATRRIARFEELFPEAIGLIARSLRAGHALTTGLGMVAEEVAEPVRSEFKLLYDRQNYGMPLAQALTSFAERVPLLDASFFATAVLTQREAGGNLAEVLDTLAALIRDRFRLKRHVRTLSAHGRMTGWVLGLLPIALGIVLTAIAPKQMAPLFTDPIGIRMVAGALALQAVGILIMRRIIDIEV